MDVYIGDLAHITQDCDSDVTETATDTLSPTNSCIVESAVTHDCATSNSGQVDMVDAFVDIHVAAVTDMEQSINHDNHDNSTLAFDRNSNKMLTGANSLLNTYSNHTCNMHAHTFDTEADAICDSIIADLVSLETVQENPLQLPQICDTVLTKNDAILLTSSSLQGHSQDVLVTQLAPTDNPVQPYSCSSQQPCQDNSEHIPTVDAQNCESAGVWKESNSRDIDTTEISVDPDDSADNRIVYDGPVLDRNIDTTDTCIALVADDSAGDLYENINTVYDGLVFNRNIDTTDTGTCIHVNIGADDRVVDLNENNSAVYDGPILVRNIDTTDAALAADDGGSDLHESNNTVYDGQDHQLLRRNPDTDGVQASDTAVTVCASDPFYGEDFGLAALFAVDHPRPVVTRVKERSRAAKARKKQQQKLSRLLQASKGHHHKGSRHKFAQNFQELQVQREIIHNVDGSLMCPVCLEMYLQPSICQPCGHIFCDLCLRRLAGQGSEGVPCPLCRTVIMSCEVDREFDEQLMLNQPDIYSSRSLAYKDSKFRRHNLPFTPLLPLSERLLRHLAASRSSQSATRWRSHDWYKFLLGCAAGVCICGLILLLLRVRTVRTATDINVMFISLLLGASVTYLLYRVCRL